MMSRTWVWYLAAAVLALLVVVLFLNCGIEATGS